MPHVTFGLICECCQNSRSVELELVLFVLCNILLDVFKGTQGHSSHKDMFEEFFKCCHFCLSVVLVLCKCTASLEPFLLRAVLYFGLP